MIQDMAIVPPQCSASYRPISGTTVSATTPCADAILDRLMHNAHRIVIHGESKRKRNVDLNVNYHVVLPR